MRAVSKRTAPVPREGFGREGREGEEAGRGGREGRELRREGEEKEGREGRARHAERRTPLCRAAAAGIRTIFGRK